MINKKYCVVTPYYKEDRDQLERCMRSVREQSVPADHLLVADGFPQDWIDGEAVRHIKLDRAHGDFGNTARGIGALAAVAEKYDGIAYLDADNWYDADHLESCLAAAQRHPDRVDYVIARRKFVRPDGSLLPVVPAEMPDTEHVDTNCLFFLPMSYHLIHRWCIMPRELSAFGDRLFHYMCKNASFVPAIVEKRTVNYVCLFENIYRSIGETPVPGAKPPVDWNHAQSWLDSLTPEQFLVTQTLTGLHLRK